MSEPTVCAVKMCARCKVKKPLSEFGIKKSWNGKRYPKHLCKPCNVACTVEWAKANPAKRKVITNRHHAIHPDRRSARIALNNALRDGRVTKRACEACGYPKSQGHHEDYSKPLDVKWLCTQCHAKEHQRAA